MRLSCRVSLCSTRPTRLVAEHIRKALGQPYTLNNHQYHSSPSIGVTLYHGKDASVDTVLQRADTAMYQAKDSGRNKVCFFDARQLEV